MKKVIQQAFPLIALTFFGCSLPAQAQAFLDPVTTNSSSFLEANLQPAEDALLAARSVNNAPLPSGAYRYGFTTADTTASAKYFNQYGYYAGTALPQTSTASVDLNTVDGSSLPQFGASLNNSLHTTVNGVCRTINLQETAASAASFIQAMNEDVSTGTGKAVESWASANRFLP